MKNARIIMIKNCEPEGFGQYERFIADNFANFEFARPYRESKMPDPEERDAVLIGGTPLSANDIDAYPFLQQEVKFLERIIKSGKPCLGICFGAQILARIFGAEIKECRPKEIGGYVVKLTDAGIKDPIFDGFSDVFPVFQWHGDMFDIPKGIPAVTRPFGWITLSASNSISKPDARRPAGGPMPIQTKLKSSGKARRRFWQNAGNENRRGWSWPTGLFGIFLVIFNGAEPTRWGLLKKPAT